jgi:hypothetical protein
MAEFHEIGSSQFTDVTPTGEEKIQISASQRTTLQNIANLAPEKGVKQVVVTNFQTNTWKLRDGGSVSFPMDIKVGEIVTFTSAQDAVKGPGVELFGYAIKQNSLMASYVGMTTSNKVNGIPTIYTYKSAGTYATAWQQLPDASVKTVEITDFAIPGLNITKDGESFLFYANDASNIPNNNHGATSFVGVAIASPIFITGDQRLLYYMMVDTARGMFYTGRANLKDDVVAWNDTPVTRLGQAVQVTAFTEGALSALLYSYKPGDFIPFYTSSVTASEANQFPESGIFNGFISMGSNEGDYFQIFAFKTGAGGKAYSGSCIGSTTTWTELGGGGGEQTVIWINANQNVFDVGLYPFTKLGEMFPIFIDTSAANNPSKEGYPCAGTVQCVGYQGPESWEAVFVVGSADEDQTPRGDYYKAHLSYDMGGSAWIELTTGSSGVKKLPGLDVELNESTDVITYTSIELVPLSAGTTLLLCFELADSDGRFSLSGNVVVYYDLPPANNLWGMIAGFFDNATSSDGSINVRRRAAGVLDFKCTSGLLEGYPGLQVYLKHIFVLG